MKANIGDKIKLIKDISYGSIYGLIKIKNGKIFTVKNRNNSDDGVETNTEMNLSNEYFNSGKKCIKIGDNKYKIIKIKVP